MTDWFIDRFATGTGSGSSPTNAALNLSSMFLAQSANINYGDRFWLRRSHNEAPTSCANNLGKASWSAASHSMSWIIGWPNTGDPYYDERPAAGVSAGWDADVSTPFSIGYPSICASYSNALTPPFGVPVEGISIANLLIVNSALPGQNNAFGFSTIWTRKQNIHLLNLGLNGAANFCMNIGDITFTTSSALGFMSFISARKITFTNSCCVVKPLTMVRGWIEEICIATNSMRNIGEGTAGWAANAQPAEFHIGRVTGIQPISGQLLDSTNAYSAPIRVSDWFGQGPVMLMGQSGNRGLYKRSVDSSAVYSGSTTWNLETQSVNTNMDQAAVWAMPNALFKNLITMTASTPLVIKWPFYTTGSIANPVSSGSFGDPFEVQFLSSCQFGNLRLVGSTGILPGSAGFWTGNSIGTGSAWLLVTSFQPRETGSAWLSVRGGAWHANRQGIIFFPPFVDVGSA